MLVDVEPFVRRVVEAADRTQAVERRDAHPRGRVRIGRAARRGVANCEAEPARQLLGMRRRGGRERASFSIGQWRCRSTTRTGRRGRWGRRRALRSRRRPPRGRPVGCPKVDVEDRLLGHDVRARPASTTPTLHVTPGQRPVSAWRPMTWCAASRIALRPLSGSTPACASRPVTVTTYSTTPLRAETMSPFARAHSRTKATSLSAATRRTCGVEAGEPISSSGFAITVSRSNGRAPAAEDRPEPVEQREQPALHVGHARAGRDPAVEPERALGDRSARKDRVHVADQDCPRTAWRPSQDAPPRCRRERPPGRGDASRRRRVPRGRRRSTPPPRSRHRGRSSRSRR